MRPFTHYFIIALAITNALGFIWAIDPDTFGMYIGMFIFMPLNILFAIVGTLKVIMIHIKKTSVVGWREYVIVISSPIIAQIILFLLIELLARKGGC